MKRFVLVLSLLAILVALATACDSMPFVAENVATDTPTRAPRPTFTPRTQASEAPAGTDTPGATETIAATETTAVTETPETQASDTATPKPVVKATRPPAPPPAPTQPPAPQFAVHPDYGPPKPCPQDGIDEIVIYIKRDGATPRPFAGGLYYAVFSGGQILKYANGKDLIGGPTDTIGTLSYGVNCGASYDPLHPNLFNGKLDVSDAARQGTSQMILRFIRSPSDLTPISADVPLDFSQGVRWWVSFGYSGG